MIEIVSAIAGAALVALAVVVRDNRRLRADRRAAEVDCDWLRQLLNRRGWRADRAHEPQEPRLYEEPPRHG